MNSFVLRPIKLKDLNQLKQLTQEMSSPIASLPNDKKLLKSRIELSLRSFKKTVSQPSREYYLFVLEDLVNKKNRRYFCYKRKGRRPKLFFRL